jgi:hypothetical protein
MARRQGLTRSQEKKRAKSKKIRKDRKKNKNQKARTNDLQNLAKKHEIKKSITAFMYKNVHYHSARVYKSNVEDIMKYGPASEVCDAKRKECEAYNDLVKSREDLVNALHAGPHAVNAVALLMSIGYENRSFGRVRQSSIGFLYDLLHGLEIENKFLKQTGSYNAEKAYTITVALGVIMPMREWITHQYLSESRRWVEDNSDDLEDESLLIGTEFSNLPPRERENGDWDWRDLLAKGLVRRKQYTQFVY